MSAADQNLSELYKLAAIGRLLASVVHEINTPIGSITSNNEVMRRAIEALGRQLAGLPEVPAKVKELLDMLQSLVAVDKIACDRIASVVRSLRSVSRSDAGEPRSVDIHLGLLDNLQLAATGFKNRVQVITEFGALPDVECFPQALGQVFLNLLVNAGHAIPGEGTITIRTFAEGDMVRVSISDTGVGIPDEIKPYIFTPGFTTKPVGVGMGLGLKIAREIVVDLHGGSLDFESRPGEGTTFHVRIPVKRRSSC
jgi:signal transduction histidine kinase